MKYYKINNGVGSGKQRITSFDSALIDAGVGNYNLVRLSSILPLDSKKKENIELPLGSLLPIAYAVESTDIDIEIAAAVAIGYPVEKDSEHCAVIMEYEGACSEEQAVATVLEMINEGFRVRGWELDSVEVSSNSAIGEKGEWTTVFACVAEWEE